MTASRLTLVSFASIAIALAAIAIWCAVSGHAYYALPIGAVSCVVVGIGLTAVRSIDEAVSALEHESEKHKQTLAQVGVQSSVIDDLADGIDVALFICDARGVIEYANKRALSSFKLDNVTGRSLLAMTLSHELESLVLECSGHRKQIHREVALSYPDERTYLAHLWMPKNTSNRVFLTLFDITDLRRLERVRQDFVANVSHELRTPLTLIRAMAETLLDADDPEPTESQQRYLDKIVGEVDRLTSISRDLLTLSAAESTHAKREPVDITDVVRGVCSQLLETAHDKGLELTYEGDEGAYTLANPLQIGQVVTNLVQNAISYTPQGSVTARVRQDESWISIEVQDTGIGISSENQQRVFERFFRVDKARSRATGGTGLGLAIVRHIVESHGGKVSLKSILGQGSTFTITLPVVDPEPKAA